MAQQVLEGTWEEIAAHAGELAGKRLTVIVETDAPEEATMNIAVIGPPNEGMLSALREIEERQKGRRFTSGKDTQEMIRQARNGGMYGLEPVDD